MVWATNRKSRLPANWPQLRAHILERDAHRCQIRGPRCISTANQCDHIIAGDDHSPSNLQAACRPCHADKTSAEGVAAQPRHRRAAERHPGLLW